MPASSDRLGVSSLRPWMPVENDPADPNALTQSLQLICSLTPRSTVPSTRWVIIWLKRCLPKSLIDPALESAPVTGGARQGPSQLLSLGGGAGQGPSQLLSLGGGAGQGPSLSQDDRDCANAGDGCSCTSTSQTDAMSPADAIKLRVVNLAMVSARTACRWDHRQGGVASAKFVAVQSPAAAPQVAAKVQGELLVF